LRPRKPSYAVIVAKLQAAEKEIQQLRRAGGADVLAVAQALLQILEAEEGYMAPEHQATVRTARAVLDNVTRPTTPRSAPRRTGIRTR